jgi:prepilin-type processing-associated H-X9-DG protein
MNNTRRKRIDWGGWLAVAALFGIIIAMVYPMFRYRGERPHSGSAQCSNNLKQIGMAVYGYMSDWDGRLPVLHTMKQRAPKGEAWPDLLRPHVKTKGILSCSESPEGLLTYSFNRRLSGRRGAPVEGMVQKEYRFTNAAGLVLVFDSVNNSTENNNLNGDAIWRSSYGRIPLPGSLVVWPDSEACRDWPKWARPRHAGSTLILFMDGHVKTADDMIRLPFDPAKPKE